MSATQIKTEEEKIVAFRCTCECYAWALSWSIFTKIFMHSDNGWKLRAAINVCWLWCTNQSTKSNPFDCIQFVIDVQIWKWLQFKWLLLFIRIECSHIHSNALHIGVSSGPTQPTNQSMTYDVEIQQLLQRFYWFACVCFCICWYQSIGLK